MSCVDYESFAFCHQCVCASYTFCNWSLVFLQLKDKERQVIKDKFKVRITLAPHDQIKSIFRHTSPLKLLTVATRTWKNKQIWPLSSSLPRRVLMTGWRSCVRSRRVGPSQTKISETSSVSLRRKWCLMLTGPSCRGESDTDGNTHPKFLRTWDN